MKLDNEASRPICSVGVAVVLTSESLDTSVMQWRRCSGVTRGCGGTAPGDTLQGVKPEGKKILWANLQRIVEKRGRTGKKMTRHPGGGDTQVKAIKSDSDSDSGEQKRLPGFSGKK